MLCCCSFNAELAERLVPIQPSEEEALQRGSMLASVLTARLDSNRNSISSSSSTASTNSSSSGGDMVQDAPPLFKVG